MTYNKANLSASPCRPALRAGLQLKMMLILTLLVISIATAGGWLYYGASVQWLASSDRHHALGLAEMLASSLRVELIQHNKSQFQQLLDACIEHHSIKYASFVDPQGTPLAEAADSDDIWVGLELKDLPVSMTSVERSGHDQLIVAKPILVSSSDSTEGRLLGALRLVIDTSRSAETLASIQQHVISIATVVILLAVPIGYLLVWRVFVQRIKRLVSVTRRLGEGDFDVRADMGDNDEIGELADSFDAMAGEVARMQDELVQANLQLEHKVDERTSELQFANLRLREEMSEKEDFMRAVSHDLNAPLRNIGGMAKMVAMKWGDKLPGEVMSRLERIQSNVHAGGELIDDLLELSRVRSRPENHRLTDMGLLIEKAGHTLEHELDSRNIELKIAQSMPTLYVGPNRLRQVFQNLIDNAIKYMDRTEGGLIEVGYELAGGWHCFSVADNGPGIPADQCERVFHVFRRIQDTKTAKIDGKGVGLSLVKTVAANYDGRAWVESHGSAGATFFISLSAEATEQNEVTEILTSENSDAESIYDTVSG